MFKITKETAIKVLENIIKNIKKDEILLLSLNKLKNILIDEFNCLKKINNNVEKEEEEETPTRPEIKRKRRKNKAKKLLNRK